MDLHEAKLYFGNYHFNVTSCWLHSCTALVFFNRNKEEIEIYHETILQITPSIWQSFATYHSGWYRNIDAICIEFVGNNKGHLTQKKPSISWYNILILQLPPYDGPSCIVDATFSQYNPSEILVHPSDNVVGCWNCPIFQCKSHSCGYLIV